MAVLDEEPRRLKRLHEIGQDLSLLSVAELAERIVALRDEIERLETEMAAKSATKTAADALFRRS